MSSFIRTLRVTRRQLIAQAAFPPDQVATSIRGAIRGAIDEILTEPLGERRLRAFPRAVKRKMSNYQLKRAHHRAWPQPTLPPPTLSASPHQPYPPQHAEALKPEDVPSSVELRWRPGG